MLRLTHYFLWGAVLFLLSVPLWAHEAQVLRVVDGDTFEAKVSIWPGWTVTTLVRVRGIDTPEMRGKCEDERVLAQTARDLAVNWLGEQADVVNIELDKYGGRVVADVYVHDESLAQLLLDTGLAKPYDGGKKQEWCE